MRDDHSCSCVCATVIE
ncbi:TPA: hypothetical protein MJA60_21930 [Klebsiella pneumoniae]|nr:hypothetical protein [Klebsiella pneumoniae]HBZ0070238.1 hypothetical protein [Klebsiella pneumoniae subsp. ozaenae]HBY9762717.1 hypothetical protein [Klebsiella pneumoniae]HBY9767672.1 hypothetical protein [Klebsiella pneumoniae]HBY9777341.1 hypothetical protein [Klebsiella pneumoniae]